MSIDPIVQQLRAARLAARRSQRSVAQAVGLNQATICEAETGKHGATLASARRWAAALGFELVLREIGPGSTSPESGPAVGVRVSEEDFRRAVKEIDPAQFRRESLGEWPPDASPEPGPELDHWLSGPDDSTKDGTS